MRKRLFLTLGGIGVLLLAGAGLFFSMNLSALEEPGRFETSAATWAKRRLIGRAARGITLPAETGEAAVVMGRMQFRADCGACHGSDGRTPTEIGRAMSPRAPDLGGAETQAWSDAELFWIIKHGIKLTGMPGFGPQHDDERIWHLVAYVREIARQPQP